MITKIKDSVKNSSIEQMFKYYYRLFFGLMFISVFMLAVYFYYGLQDNSIMPIIASLSIFVVIGFLFYCRYHLSMIFLELLTTDVNLEKTRDFFRYASKHSIKIHRNNIQQESHLADSQYYYYTGDFAQSTESLKLLDIKKVNWLNRKARANIIPYYQLRNALHLKDFDSYNRDFKTFQHLKGKYTKARADKLTAIHAVLTGEPTTYFDEKTFKTKLEKIEATYYSGLNQLNQGNKEAAKTSFEQIVNENPDLFYVKEARQYLEELEDKNPFQH